MLRPRSAVLGDDSRARFRLIRALREAVCGLSDEKFAFYGGSVERNGDISARQDVFRAFYRGSVERNDDVLARNNIIRERKSLFRERKTLLRERRTLFRERRDLFRERRNVALGRRECAPASIRTATVRPGDHSPRPTVGPAPPGRESVQQSVLLRREIRRSHAGRERRQDTWRCWRRNGSRIRSRNGISRPRRTSETA